MFVLKKKNNFAHNLKKIQPSDLIIIIYMN